MGANLITLDEYKVSEKKANLKDDIRLESLITSVSQLVKTYCANSFVDYYDTDKVELFSPNYSTQFLQTTESPLVSVTEVKVRASYSSDYVILTDTAFEFYVDYDTDTVHRTTTGGYGVWEQGPGAVQVSYKAGYASDAIPEDLKLAVTDLVTYYEKDEYKARRTLAGASISNDPTSTQWRNVSFPDHIKRVLDLYKQVFI